MPGICDRVMMCLNLWSVVFIARTDPEGLEMFIGTHRIDQYRAAPQLRGSASY
jgi:hypothetical protein